jgi:hypothetical protein
LIGEETLQESGSHKAASPTTRGNGSSKRTTENQRRKILKNTFIAAPPDKELAAFDRRRTE